MSADGREELRTRVRVEEPSPDAAVVIRGGPDTPSLLQSHARRLNRLYVLDCADVFGIPSSLLRRAGRVGEPSSRASYATRHHVSNQCQHTEGGRLRAIHHRRTSRRSCRS
jgi:hypothetical protein